MTLILAIIISVLGAAIGSFLSVVIYRTHTDQKGILLSRSLCPSCKKKLKWRHLVPVFSWLFLGGKCAYCGKRISSHYLLLELTTALAFLAIFLHWNFLEFVPPSNAPELLNYAINWPTFYTFIFYILEFSLLVGIFFSDLLYKEIPDRLSIPAIVIATFAGLLFNPANWLPMLIGGLALFLFFFLQYIISKGAWIGGGDLRLGFLMGAILGLEKGLFALVIAYAVGAIFSIILLITKKATRKTAIAFGPFLIIGLTTMIFFGEQILNFYFK